MRIPLTLRPLALAIACSPCFAQWPTNVATNFAVGDAASDQNQTKLAQTPDGGVWVSWFDGIASGWDVRLQRLDAQGNEVFAHNGVLVADRSFSSTQDYGLAMGAGGGALLAFRDDSGGSTEIAAAIVLPNGTQPWGPNGVALTSGAGFVASPKIFPSPSGGAWVAWTENNGVRLQQLDGSGTPLWASPVTLAPSAGSYVLADIHGSTGGAVTVSIVHQTGGFSSPRHLVAQRLDSLGNPTWGAQPLPIFTSGSLQFGNFPAFVPDGAGGSVFAWYSSSPTLQSFVQRVDANGVTQWATNGVPVATTAGFIRTAPHVRFDAQDESVYVAWNAGNTTQSQSGIGAQRFDAAGNRLWTNDGVTLAALGSDSHTQARILPGGPGGGAFVVWDRAPSFGADQLFGAHVSPGGTIGIPTFGVASTPSGKARLAIEGTRTGQLVCAWSDDRSDGGDILLQSFAFDGTPGGPISAGTNYCTAQVNSTGSPGLIGAFGSDQVALNQVTLLATQLPNNQFGFFLTSKVQGLISMPGGSQGDLCLDFSIGRYNKVTEIFFTGPSDTGVLELDLAQTPTPTTPVSVLAGETWNFQAWYRDMNPSNTSNFTNGVSISFL